MAKQRHSAETQSKQQRMKNWSKCHRWNKNNNNNKNGSTPNYKTWSKLHTVFGAPPLPFGKWAVLHWVWTPAQSVGRRTALSSLPLSLEVVKWSELANQNSLTHQPSRLVQRRAHNPSQPNGILPSDFWEKCFSSKFTSYEDDAVLEPTVANSLPCAECLWEGSDV